MQESVDAIKAWVTEPPFSARPPSRPSSPFCPPGQIKKQIYKNRALAIADVAQYIDTFYNSTRRHSHLGGVSPEIFEAAHKPHRKGVH